MSTAADFQVIPTVPSRRRIHLAWITVVALAVLALAGFVGYLIGRPAPKPVVHIEKTVTGTISLLNTSHDAGCVRLEHPNEAKSLGPPYGPGGVCGVFAVSPSQTLHTGENVAVAVMQSVDEHGGAYRHLLVV
jgi:hypothetical protein